MTTERCWQVSVMMFLAIGLGAGSGCKRLFTNHSLPSPASAKSATAFQDLLTSGDKLCDEFDAHALRREYSEMSQLYELLRLNYIDAADRLRTNGELGTAQAFATLERWEQVITKFRGLWAEPNQLSEADQQDLSPQMKELLKQGDELRAQKNAEWAPVEKQLDEALKVVLDLRNQSKF